MTSVVSYLIYIVATALIGLPVFFNSVIDFLFCMYLISLFSFCFYKSVGVLHFFLINL